MRILPACNRIVFTDFSSWSFIAEREITLLADKECVAGLHLTIFLAKGAIISASQAVFLPAVFIATSVSERYQG